MDTEIKLTTGARTHSRRTVVRHVACLALGGMLVACGNQAQTFKSTDITGSDFGKGMRLLDHFGNRRAMSDFPGKIPVVFFGFTQCPDVCPTSMNTLAEVKKLLGDRGDLLQVLFITVDPERDTEAVLRAYMQNFDPAFLALRPELDELKAIAESFKVYYKKVDGKTPTSYTMDHSAGKYIFDTSGRARLFSAYGTDAATIAQDIQALLSS